MGHRARSMSQATAASACATAFSPPESWANVQRTNGMRLTSFAFPTPTVFGADALAELRKRLTWFGISAPLVVTDSGLVKTSTFRALRDTLGSEGENTKWFLYS